MWAPFSVDAQRGLVYLPVSTPSNDGYGGTRLGDNLYAESVVCLDARTGTMKWHFQTIHHGLWDYDLPAPPVLGSDRRGLRGRVGRGHGVLRVEGVLAVAGEGLDDPVELVLQ